MLLVFVVWWKPGKLHASCGLAGGESSAVVVGVNGECKVVLVIPLGLNMSPGKVGAQCAHAAVGMYRVCVCSSFHPPKIQMR